MKNLTAKLIPPKIFLTFTALIFAFFLITLTASPAKALSTCDFCGSPPCAGGGICITDTTPQDPECGAAGVKYCGLLNCTDNSECAAGSCCAVDNSNGTAWCVPIELAGGVVENRICMENPQASRGDCLEVIDALVWTNPAREMGLDRAAEAICNNIQTAPPDGCSGLCNALTTLAEKNSADGSGVQAFCGELTAPDGDCWVAPN